MAERHDQAGNLGLDVVELALQFVGRPTADVVLDRTQPRIPAEDARAHPELVDRRQRARQRNQHRDQPDQHRPHAVDKVRQPERQVALQQRRAAGVEALRFLRQRLFGGRGVRELALALKPARAAVDLPRRLHEQLHQRRVHALACDQRGGGRDQVHVLRRHVSRQIDHAARQRDGRQIREAARIGLGLAEVEQRDAGRLQQHLHHQRFRRRGEHQRVEVTGQQVDDGGGLRLAQQRDRGGVEVVGVDQLGHQVGHAAARRADVHAPAGELRDGRERGRVQALLRHVGAVEHPDRLEEQAAERDQRFVVLVDLAQVFVGAALHEGDVDARGRVAQQLQVIGRALGVAQLDRDAVFLQHLGVALAELGIRAEFSAGGEHHVLRRRRVQRPVSQGQQGQREHDEGAGGGEHVAQRKQGLAQVAGHRHGGEVWAER